MGKPVAISAHKGGSDDAFSRHGTAVTYETYKNAIGSAAEYVEFDIRRTRDGVLVVYHDEHAGDSGSLVKDLPYGRLCEILDYAAPRVEDVMRLLGGKVIGHLDLKEVGYEAAVMNLALETFGPGNFVATSLEDASILTIKQDFPQVTAALSLGRDLAEVPRTKWASVRYSELSPLRRIRACRADWVAVNHKLAHWGVLKLCSQHGIGAMVWTVDSDDLIDRFLTDERVNVLITNRPKYAVCRRGKLAPARVPATAAVPDGAQRELT
jgi:glycerophosphoryl diester phosphodiesterase